MRSLCGEELARPRADLGPPPAAKRGARCADHEQKAHSRGGQRYRRSEKVPAPARSQKPGPKQCLRQLSHTVIKNTLRITSRSYVLLANGSVGKAVRRDLLLTYAVATVRVMRLLLDLHWRTFVYGITRFPPAPCCVYAGRYLGCTYAARIILCRAALCVCLCLCVCALE